jgi:putative sterol carrier protein
MLPADFEAVLRRFLTLCETDAALSDFAQKRRGIMQYQLTDRDIEFYMTFGDGQFRAGLGPAPQKPDFIIIMDAETFDGVMTGQIAGPSAGMSGRIKFKGDTMKAMALLKLGADMTRLYQQALAGVLPA